MKYLNSESLFERSKRVSPGGVHSPVRSFRSVGGVPRFICEARGAEIKDVDGNRYIDFCMAFGPLIFGHKDEEIEMAVRNAMTKGWSYGTAEEASLTLAELICDSIPWIEKIRFVNSGTEAVMSALRVARAATGRDKIVKFDGCYHGHVDSMLINALVKAGLGSGISSAVASETIVAPLNNLLALEEIFSHHGKEIAAVIIEPIPANNGLLLQAPDFLPTLIKIAHASGTLVIFDEVITGFRVGFTGMAGKMELKPDLVTYGKIIGGGFPVGAFGGKKELMDLVAPLGNVYQAGTLSANPIAMAAGVATLKKLLRTDPYPLLEKYTEELSCSLEKLALHPFGLPFRVEKAASLFWIDFGSNSLTQKKIYPQLFHSLLEQGIYLPPSGVEVCFLSTAHTLSDLEKMTHAFEKFLKEHIT